MNAVPLFNSDMNISRRYRIINHQAIDNSINTAPSYNMHQRDGVNLPETQAFSNAYKLVTHPVLISINEGNNISNLGQNHLDKHRSVQVREETGPKQ
jgi:hypothetical protein